MPAVAKTKQMFGVPSLELAGRIDDHDKITNLEAATYRCRSRMRELEQQFEAKAAEIRSAYLAEATDAIGSEE